MVECKYCGLKLNGMGSIFADSGAGVSVIKCARCHHYSYSIKESKEITKQASWGAISGALGAIAPAVAAMGIWDLSVAYSTFKKVLESTHRAQMQASNPSFNPFWTSGKLNKKAEEGVEMPGGQEEEGGGDEQFSYQTHEVSYDDPIGVSDAVISIGHLEEFLKDIIPHVVKFSIDKQDGNILMALGKLGAIIREAKKAHRISSEMEGKEYQRTYLSS